MSRLPSSPRLRSAPFGLLPAILLVAGSPQVRVAVAYLAPFLLRRAPLLAFAEAGRAPPGLAAANRVFFSIST